MKNKQDSPDTDFKDIEHKILFLFMPDSIVFEKQNASEDPDVTLLKSISPYFYWCSAHEFPNFSKEYRYLIQYQLYTVDSGKIIPNEIAQEWHTNKNQIKYSMISFLDSFENHKRLLLNPDGVNANNNSKNKSETSSYNKISQFSNFSKVIAEWIFHFKNNYISEVEGGNFNTMQKDFWKMIAMNGYINVSKDNKNFLKPKKAVKKPVAKKKSNKNKQNEKAR
jgi:hypothetical protein